MFPGEVSRFPTPIPETRAESMDSITLDKAVQNFRKCHVRKRRIFTRTRKHEIAVSYLLHLLDDFDGAL